MEKNKFGYTTEECKVNIECVKTNLELLKAAYEADLVSKEDFAKTLKNLCRELEKFMF